MKRYGASDQEGRKIMDKDAARIEEAARSLKELAQELKLPDAVKAAAQIEKVASTISLIPNPWDDFGEKPRARSVKTRRRRTRQSASS
jgi:hypothetical protein